jgi:hypothetical protein
LLAHLILFGFVYPHERDRIPSWVVNALIAKLDETPPADARGPLCLGTLLSRSQYLRDLESGFRDGRLVYHTMSPGDIAHWTAAAGEPTPGASGNGTPPEPRSRRADSNALAGRKRAKKR